MAQQKTRRRFHDDKPVPYSGRKRVKKKRGKVAEEIPEGWSAAMSNRAIKRQRVGRVS